MNNRIERPTVLSIAGFDPSGGAGVLADCKTFEQLGVQGMAVITANTVQTEDRLFAVDWIDLDRVQQGIRQLMQRYATQVVKIGVLKDVAFLKGMLHAVRSENPDAFLIWDPVLKSSSGYPFFDEGKMRHLPEILSDIDLITPNLEEYQVLEPYLDRHTSGAVLLKGGHRRDKPGVDSLLLGGSWTDFPAGTAQIHPKHGSGCVLSSAIAAYVALGHNTAEACQKAKRYTERFLNSHPSLLGFHYDNA